MPGPERNSVESEGDGRSAQKPPKLSPRRLFRPVADRMARRRRQCPQKRHHWSAENKQWRRDRNQQLVLSHVRRKECTTQRVKRRDERDDYGEASSQKRDRFPRPHAASDT